MKSLDLVELILREGFYEISILQVYLCYLSFLTFWASSWIIETIEGILYR